MRSTSAVLTLDRRKYYNLLQDIHCFTAPLLNKCHESIIDFAEGSRVYQTDVFTHCYPFPPLPLFFCVILLSPLLPLQLPDLIIAPPLPEVLLAPVTCATLTLLSSCTSSLSWNP